MKRQKKIGVGVASLLSIVAIGLSGCAPKASDDSSTENSAGTSSVTTSDSGNASMSVDSSVYDTSGLVDDLTKGEDGKVSFDEQVDLKIWCIIGDPDQAVFRKRIDAFNKEYSGMINLSVVYQGHFDYYNALDTTYQTDFDASFPDICIMHNEKTVEYANKGYLYPLDDLFDKTTVNSLDFTNVYSNIDRVTKLNGHRFAVPMDAHGFITSFRQDIIKKNELGFDNNTRYIPNSKTEYQTLLEGLRSKADAGTLLIRSINKGEDHSWKAATSADFYPEFMQSTDPDGLGAIYANSGTMADTDQKKVTFQDSDGFQTYLTDQVDRYNNRLMGESGTNTEMFGKGNTVMFPEGPWWVSQTYTIAYNNSDLTNAGALGVTAEEAADDVYSKPYVAAHPQSWWTLDSHKSDENGGRWYGNGHAISLTRHIKSLQKAAAALTFATWYTQGKDADTGEYNLATWCTSGHIPAWKNVYESNDYQKELAKSMTLRALGDPADIIAMEGLKYETTIFNGVSSAVASVQTALRSAEGCTKDQALKILTDTASSTQSALDLLQGE
jgi:hypothetical protein